MPPEEFFTPKMATLQEFVDSQSPESLMIFPPLNENDCKLFGQYIQLYGYIELNLRRCIEIFAISNKLDKSLIGKYQFLRAFQLNGAIKQVVERLELSQDDKKDIIEKLDDIESKREFRHMMAHWAARRFPHHDAILFLTKNASEAKKITRLGHIAKDELMTAIVDTADIRGLVVHINLCGEWLAHKTSEWHQLYIKSTAR